MTPLHNNIETHPWAPFIPAEARVLIMGTFPPGAHRWAMDFYYPNRTNDFWRIMGLIFEGDADAFYDRATRNYRLDEIKELLTAKGIALSDTAHEVRRLKGNASDKFLEIVEPVELSPLLAAMPSLRAIATTGEKAAQTLADITCTQPPAIGSSVGYDSAWHGEIQLWRLPSTSRAYPLALEKKAEYYHRFFAAAGIAMH